jgi:hypothetical protein
MAVRLAVVAVACALAACGAEAEQTSTGGPWGRTFGLTGADLRVMDAVTGDMERFTRAYNRFAGAVTVSDGRAARRAVASMDAALTKAEDRLAEVSNERLQRFKDDYLGTLRRLTDAGDRMLTYYEAPGSGSPREERQVLAELEAASNAAREAEQGLRRRLLENATAAQRETLLREFRRIDRRFDRAVTQGGG